jgi:transcriptional regulator GlxA family with amidase domain
MGRGRAGTVNWCGHLTFVPPPHRHEVLELNFVQRGSCTYLIDGRCYEFEPGHVAFLFPAQEHALLDTSNDYRAWVAHVRSDFVREICTTVPTQPLARKRPPQQFASALPPGRARHLVRLFDALSDAMEDDAQFNTGLAFAVLTSWVEHLRARAIVPKAPREPAVERVIRLLRDESRLSLRDLARAAGMSRSVLTRSFKRQTGLSIVAYKNRLRVERFLALQAEAENMTLLEAALAAGFGSYAQFYRVFREVMGHAPSRIADRPSEHG